MPGAIVMRWNHEVARGLDQDEMKTRMQSEGLGCTAGPLQLFGNVIRRNVQKWRSVIKQATMTQKE